MEKPDKKLFEKIVKIAQNRGFVFNASSIYGGLRSSYDYGPLGKLLKDNISKLWWESLKTSDIEFIQWTQQLSKVQMFGGPQPFK